MANPILKILCRSFYEEGKWQEALLVNVNANDEWISSVTVTMVAFAATSVSSLDDHILIYSNSDTQYYNALEEWKSGNFIQKPFELDKYAGHYTNIFNRITCAIVARPQGHLIEERLKSWVEERYVAH